MNNTVQPATELAGMIVPIAYTAWSLWLVITGIVLFIA
jgi:hypothetical protein